MKRYLQLLFSAVVCFLLWSTHTAAQSVGVDTFQKGMQAPAVQIFDVRTSQEFNTGHIPGALQADFTNKEQFEERVKYLDKQKPVYIYCLSGGRSAAAAEWMRQNGFREVVEMDGGIRAWKAASKPLEGGKEEKQLTTAQFQQSVQHGLVLVDVGAVWCPPCRLMEPVLQEFLQQHKNVKLVRVDGGKDQQVMEAIGAKVLPTFVFYKDGKEQWRKQGVVELAELEKQLK